MPAPLLGRDRRWRTAVSASDDSGGARLRGYALLELAASDRVPFSDLLYLTATGELPDAGHSRMLRMMLGVTVAQGISLTGVATRAAAAAGVPTQVAICAGLTTIGDEVGGAGEELARDLQRALPLAEANSLDARRRDEAARDVASALAASYIASRGRVPGFGHVLHRDGDPRAALLLSLAPACGVDGVYVDVLRRLEAAVAARAGRRIPPNIDGADAALLCELGMPWPYARPLVMLGRMVGLAGIAAEAALEGASLPAGLLDFDYVGPAQRALPADRAG